MLLLQVLLLHHVQQQQQMLWAQAAAHAPPVPRQPTLSVGHAVQQVNRT
jgi:hypothetical protein